MKLIHKFKSLFFNRLYWKNVYRYYRLIVDQTKVLPKKIDLFDGHKILVIAPHIDDELIGCGGTLYKHYQRGAEINVVYLASETETRKQESQQISKFMGYKTSVVYDFPVVMVGEYEKDITKIFADAIERINPELIYLPFLPDRHTDHVNTNKFLIKSLESAGKKDILICGYEVWTPLIPNYIVNVSEVIEQKQQAIALCKSQLKYTDYIALALSLNRYRGESIGFKYGEAFYAIKSQGYIDLWKKIYAKI